MIAVASTATSRIEPEANTIGPNELLLDKSRTNKAARDERGSGDICFISQVRARRAGHSA
jgi:hypothetical protein